MATWDQLNAYIHERYRVLHVTPAGQLALRFDVGGGRSQSVLVSPALDGSNGDQWAKIESIVGPEREVDMAMLLELIRFQLVGGLAKNDDYVTVRHSIPLADMSVDEFEAPLAALLETADHLERLASGGADRF